MNVCVCFLLLLLYRLQRRKFQFFWYFNDFSNSPWLIKKYMNSVKKKKSGKITKSFNAIFTQSIYRDEERSSSKIYGLSSSSWCIFISLSRSYSSSPFLFWHFFPMLPPCVVYLFSISITFLFSSVLLVVVLVAILFFVSHSLACSLCFCCCCCSFTATIKHHQISKHDHTEHVAIAAT